MTHDRFHPSEQFRSAGDILPLGFTFRNGIQRFRFATNVEVIEGASHVGVVDHWNSYGES